jgi:hypothetical protein
MKKFIGVKKKSRTSRPLVNKRTTGLKGCLSLNTKGKSIKDFRVKLAELTARHLSLTA